jgi:hypothetical protein
VCVVMFVCGDVVCVWCEGVARLCICHDTRGEIRRKDTAVLKTVVAAVTVVAMVVWPMVMLMLVAVSRWWR